MKIVYPKIMDYADWIYRFKNNLVEFKGEDQLYLVTYEGHTLSRLIHCMNGLELWIINEQYVNDIHHVSFVVNAKPCKQEYFMDFVQHNTPENMPYIIFALAFQSLNIGRDLAES